VPLAWAGGHEPTSVPQVSRAETIRSLLPERMALRNLAWASACRLCWRATPTDHWRTEVVGRLRARCWPPRRRWSGSSRSFFSLLCLTAGADNTKLARERGTLGRILLPEGNGSAHLTILASARQAKLFCMRHHALLLREQAVSAWTCRCFASSVAASRQAPGAKLIPPSESSFAVWPFTLFATLAPPASGDATYSYRSSPRPRGRRTVAGAGVSHTRGSVWVSRHDRGAGVPVAVNPRTDTICGSLSMGKAGAFASGCKARFRPRCGGRRRYVPTGSPTCSASFLITPAPLRGLRALG